MLRIARRDGGDEDIPTGLGVSGITMNDDREQWLQQRAYAIWETEGCPEGRHREHWQQAERELSAAHAVEQYGSSLASAGEPVAESTGKRPRRGAPKATTSTAAARRKKTPELRP